MIYIELAKANVSQDVLQCFDCGHPDFNEFLSNDAQKHSASGAGVTYILVDKNEVDKQITTVFAFATIKTSSLYYFKEGVDTMFSIPCAELKYFAISKSFQRSLTGKLGVEKYYSTVFFEILLADLYEMSTKVIGFTGIFLRSNEAGERLYRRKHFIDASDFVIPYEEDDKLGKCTPMYLSFADNVYGIFGME